MAWIIFRVMQSIQLLRKQAEDSGSEPNAHTGLRETSGFKFVTTFDSYGTLR